jgi:hypothetical protein
MPGLKVEHFTCNVSDPGVRSLVCGAPWDVGPIRLAIRVCDGFAT